MLTRTPTAAVLLGHHKVAGAQPTDLSDPAPAISFRLLLAMGALDDLLQLGPEEFWPPEYSFAVPQEGIPDSRASIDCRIIGLPDEVRPPHGV